MSPASASIVMSGVTVTTDCDISSPTVTSRIPRIADRLPQLHPTSALAPRALHRDRSSASRRGAAASCRSFPSSAPHLFHVPLHQRLYLLVLLLHLGLHLLNYSHHLRHPGVVRAV